MLGEEAFEGRPNKMCEVDNGVMVHRSLVVYRKKEASREPPHIVGERYFEHARLRLRFLWHTSLLYHVKNCTKYRQNSIEEKNTLCYSYYFTCIAVCSDVHPYNKNR